MSRVDEYRQQQAWRDWDDLLDRVPLAPGQTVWDVGCGVGEVSARLAARGARVWALDADPDMIAAARRRAPDGVDFQLVDLRVDEPGGPMAVDGIWCGFSMAYFVDAPATLRRWTRDMSRLAAGAWIAVLEIDRLFTGHAPLPAAVASAFADFERALGERGDYDVRMGARIAGHLEALGFEIIEHACPADPELHFAGPAPEQVIAGWSRRFARMTGLQAHLGARFAGARDAFLRCLQDPQHTSVDTLHLVVGRWPG